MTLDLFDHRDEDFGGSVTYFLPNLAEAEAQLGIEPTVHLLTSNGRSARRVRGFDVEFHPCIQPPRRLGLQRRFGRQLSAHMISAVARGSFDVVHFYGLRNSPMMLAGITLLCKRRHIPLVAHDQGARAGWRIEEAAERYALPQIDACIVSSADAHREIAEARSSRGSIHFIPNGYDPRAFFPGEQPHPSAEPFRVLVVSRLTAEKDPMTAARAVVELGERRPAELMIAGTRTAEHGHRAVICRKEGAASIAGARSPERSWRVLPKRGRLRPNLVARGLEPSRS